jgi:hypothetical protein
MIGLSRPLRDRPRLAADRGASLLDPVPFPHPSNKPILAFDLFRPKAPSSLCSLFEPLFSPLDCDVIQLFTRPYLSSILSIDTLSTLKLLNSVSVLDFLVSRCLLRSFLQRHSISATTVDDSY